MQAIKRLLSRISTLFFGAPSWWYDEETTQQLEHPESGRDNPYHFLDEPRMMAG